MLTKNKKTSRQFFKKYLKEEILGTGNAFQNATEQSLVEAKRDIMAGDYMAAIDIEGSLESKIGYYLVAK
ncbi:MAG: hypothetical protein MJ252_13725, partial [archaeon]|nr:hypothetical protein [archaeon]